MHTTLKKLIFALTLAAGTHGANAEALNVNYDTTKQVIQGFGVNISLNGTVWWQNVPVSNASNYWDRAGATQATVEANIEALADRVFTQNSAAFLRVSNWYNYKEYYSAAEYATRPVGAENQVGVNYKHWLEGTVRAMKEFRQRNSKGKIVLTAWSPPPWLKENGTVLGGRSRLRSFGNQFDYNGLADWWLASLKHYQNSGIQIDYLSIQNEPDFCASGWEGNFITPTENTADEPGYPGYDKAFKAVYDKVMNSDLNTTFKNNLKFMGPDVAGIRREQVSASNATGVTRYTDALDANGQYSANSDLSRVKAISYHLYSSGDIQGTSNMNALEAAFPYTSHTKIMSEYTSTTQKLSDVRWTHTAKVIQQSLVNSRANAHILWSASDENHVALVHYSRFIPPGSIRVTTSTTMADLVASAYRSGPRISSTGAPLKDTVIVVLCDTRPLTTTTSPRTVTLASGLLDAAPAKRSVKVFRTSVYGTQPRVQQEVNIDNHPSYTDVQITLNPFDLVTVVLN